MNLQWHHERWARQSAPAPALEAARAWFDLERVARVLAPMCPPAAPLQRLAIASADYLPPQRLRVVYALHQGGGRCLHASIEARLEAGETVQAGPTAARVGLDAGSAALAWLLPDDPAELPFATVLAPACTERHLGVTLAADSAVLLAYRPGERLVQRWHVAASPALLPTQTVVLKLQPGAVTTHARLQALRDAPGRRFDVPQPLACAAAHATRWESFVVGETLEAAGARIGWEAALARVMAALADLHGRAAPLARAPAGLPLRTRAALLERLGGKVLRRVQAALPQRTDALHARIEALQRWVPPAAAAPALLHGQLHPANMRLSPAGRVSLLGFEGLARGDAAHDLAQLAARLVLLSLLGQMEAGRAWTLVAALPGLYLEALAGAPPGEHAEALRAAPPHLLRESFAWHLAALLLAGELATAIRHAAPAMDALGHELVRLAGGVIADRGEATLAP